MKSTLLLSLILTTILSGCEGKLFVGADLGKTRPTVRSLDKDEVVSGETITVVGYNLTEEVEVKLKPSREAEDLPETLKLLDISLTIDSPKSATIVIPPTDFKGIVKLVFSFRGKDIQSIPVLFNVSASEIPEKLPSASELCDDTFYKDFSGTIVRGTRSCGSQPRTCESDGDVNCLATEDHPSVIRSEIAAKVGDGLELAGEAGVLPARLPDCNASLSVDCTAITAFPSIDVAALLKPEWIKTGVTIKGVTGAYPSSTAPLDGALVGTTDLTSLSMGTAAGNYEFFDSEGRRYTGSILDGGTITPGTSAQVIASGSGVYRQVTVAGDTDLTAVNIKSGVNVFGIAGSLTGAPPTCVSDGESACLVDGVNYSAASLTSAADKIVFGQTLAGVSGNVRIPAASKVLTGTSYGIGGTALNGSLTLPSAANVRTGSGLYGDSSAQLTPSYTPDFPSAANVRANDTVDGAAGTLADCADGASGCVVVGPTFIAAVSAGLADKVVSGQSVAGVSGNVILPTANIVLTGNSYGIGGTAINGTLTLPVGGLVLSGTSFGVGGNGTSGTLTLPLASDVRTGSGLYGNPSAQLTPSYSPDMPSPANVRSNDTVGGVPGTIADCADGDGGCFVVGPTFVAAVSAGIANKVLSGQSIAGVPGNVTLPPASEVLSGNSYGVAGVGMSGSLTLPAAGLVLNGTNFGVSGTGSTGTLTLPTGSNVLSGSGLYGNPSALITPSYTPDFPLAANVRSNDTVNGSPGTLANCTDGASDCVATAPTFAAATLAGAADKILSGQSIAGVSGNVTLPAVGLVLTGTNYGVGGTAATGTLTLPLAADVKTGSGLYGNPSAQLTPSYTPDLPSPANVRSNDTVDGVPGTIANCTDGDAGCFVVGPTFAAATVAGSADKILFGQSVAGVSGNVTLPTANQVLTGNSFGVGGNALSGSLTLPAVGLVLTGTNYGVGGTGATGTLTLPAAGNVRTGTGLYGNPSAQITPSFTPDFPSVANVRANDTVDGATGTLANCTDGASDCFAASPTFAAATVSGAASKILSGQTVAGISGNVTLPTANQVLTGNSYGVGGNGSSGSLTLPAVGLVLTGTNYGVGGNGSTGTLTLPAAANVKTGSGLYGNPSAQITPSYTPDFPSLANVRSIDTVDGNSGTLLDCADGESGCVVLGPAYVAAVSAGLASKVLSGQSVGGVSGNVTLPAVGLVLTGTNYGVSGTGSTGTLTLPAAGNVRTGSGLYGNPSAQITPSYSPDFPDVANVRTSDTTNGAAGTLANCSTDNGTGCVATASYPSVVAANVTAGVVKSGTVIAGVTGAYPNATYPLSVGDGYSDLDSATFNAQIKTNTNFGWFNRNGVRQTGIGDADIDAANIGSGISIFGTSGTLTSTACSSDGQQNCITGSRYKAVDTNGLTTWDIRSGKSAGGISGSIEFYKSMANTAVFNRMTPSTGALDGVDFYDSVDDHNAGGAFPTQSPAGVASATGQSWLRHAATDTDSNGLCNGGETCIFTDRLTNLSWLQPLTTYRTWENAITYCEGLSSGGITDWRLPTVKELLQAHVNGIWSLKTKLSLATSEYYWTSTTDSTDTSRVWYGSFFSANVYWYAKNNAGFHTICVR